MNEIEPDRQPSRPAHPIARVVRVVSGAAAVGIIVGGLLGGVGGRLAMRLLAVTSDDRLRGRVTDDDEIVGRVTLGGTVGFIIFMALGGAVLAMLYVVLRRWLPRQPVVRTLAFSALFWAVQGQDIFESDGFDFSELGPRWLAVLLFTLILIGVGALTVAGVDRALGRWPTPSARHWASVMPLAPLIVFFPVLVFAGLIGLVALGIERSRLATRLWQSRAVSILGGLALVITGLWNGLPTVSEIGRILT